MLFILVFSFQSCLLVLSPQFIKGIEFSFYQVNMASRPAVSASSRWSWRVFKNGIQGCWIQ